MQAFNWESHRQNWWETVSKQSQRFADMGFTLVWLPPPTASVAAQGYMPLDLYNLNSAYGSEESLRRSAKNPHRYYDSGTFHCPQRSPDCKHQESLCQNKKRDLSVQIVPHARMKFVLLGVSRLFSSC